MIYPAFDWAQYFADPEKPAEELKDAARELAEDWER